MYGPDGTQRYSTMSRALLVAAMMLSVALALPSTNVTSEPSLLLAEEPLKCPVSCNNNRAGGAPRRPVCGSDSRTYTSACHLRRAQCQQSTLTLKHRGKCKGGAEDRPCWADRKFHLSKKPDSIAIFVPTCRSDGRYSPVQCFDTFCWCVDPRSGKPFPNSSVENKKPNCNKALRNRKEGGRGRFGGGSLSSSRDRQSDRSRGNGPRNRPKPCGRADRTTFNKNMLDTFKTEYRREYENLRTEAGVDLADLNDSEVQRHVLDWKFKMLDKNKDQQLQRHEYRGLRRIVRKFVLPRRCAKSFTRTCDSDQNDIISKDEWTECIGLDFNMLPPALLPDGVGTSSFEDDTAMQVSRGGHSSSDDDTNEEHGCLADRQTALDEMQSSNLYTPECTPDGRYLKKQCYPSTGYCFCVDEDTGKVVPGTSVKNSDPKCDSIVPPPRPMKGCPEPKKQIFLRDLMDFLRKKMPVTLLSTNSSESLQEDEEIRLPLVSAETVANFNFRQLDRNSDKALVRSEWKVFRNMMESQQSLRHCGRKLPRHCDVNRDRKISLTEWLLCLGVSGHQPAVISREPNSTANPKRVGKNPLETILNPDK